MFSKLWCSISNKPYIPSTTMLSFWSIVGESSVQHIQAEKNRNNHVKKEKRVFSLSTAGIEMNSLGVVIFCLCWVARFDLTRGALSGPWTKRVVKKSETSQKDVFLLQVFPHTKKEHRRCWIVRNSFSFFQSQFSLSLSAFFLSGVRANVSNEKLPALSILPYTILGPNPHRQHTHTHTRLHYDSCL